MKKFKRIFLIVLDSVGIGEAPDAALYNDEGAHTLGNIADSVGGLDIPQLEGLGLGLISPIKGVKKVNDPRAHYTKMIEKSTGKDTLTGHWELMGLLTKEPFQTFPEGFPVEFIKQLELNTNRRVIGNKPASGTKIIDELGEEHLKTGALIVYTSADSVLQIAAHEDVVPLDELYAICKRARVMTLEGSVRVGRVIARPFTGQVGQFVRTSNRHDYALKPPQPTVMDKLKEANYDVISLGKIYDIFDGEGITESKRTIDNADGMNKLMNTMEKDFTGLCFLNLVDFDALYGHRRDPQGYGDAIEYFDSRLPEVLKSLKETDLLILTADHGNDPTFRGTDHTREFVPLIAYHKGIERGKMLGTRETFADVGATIANNFKVKPPYIGTSFLTQLINKGDHL